MRSALFVDFDSVYSGLCRLDSAIADRFGFQPQAWTDWLIKALSLPEHAPADGRRRLLVRRCYLNPQVYQRFRPSFNRAGFEIVDCPAMTSDGKTSTDSTWFSTSWTFCSMRPWRTSAAEVVRPRSGRVLRPGRLAPAGGCSDQRGPAG